MYIFKMTRRVTTSAARKELSEIVNRAFYSGEVTVLTKHGKDLAAVVPMKDLSMEHQLQPKKGPVRAE